MFLKGARTDIRQLRYLKNIIRNSLRFVQTAASRRPLLCFSLQTCFCELDDKTQVLALHCCGRVSAFLCATCIRLRLACLTVDRLMWIYSIQPPYLFFAVLLRRSITSHNIGSFFMIHLWITFLTDPL